MLFVTLGELLFLVPDISSLCFSASSTMAFLPLLLSLVVPNVREFLPSLGTAEDVDVRATNLSNPSLSVSGVFISWSKLVT